MHPSSSQSSPRAQRGGALLNAYSHPLSPEVYPVGGYSLHSLFSSDCLPSRRLLRAVKCLLPVYCVSNCSRGGQNISQFTWGNENRIKSSEGWGRSSIKPRESYPTQPWEAQLPLHHPFILVMVAFPRMLRPVSFTNMDLGIAGILKASLPPKRVWLISQVVLSNCMKRQVIDLINDYMHIYFSFLQSKLQMA